MTPRSSRHPYLQGCHVAGSDGMRLMFSLVVLVVNSFFPSLTRLGEQERSTQTPTPPASNQASEAPHGSPPAGASTEFGTLLLREGAAVKLKLLHSLNSKTVVVDDPLNFSVAEDVVVDGKVLVKAGAVAIGRVRQAKPAGMLGRGAQLELDMQYMKVGRIRVPLRGSQVRAGQDKKGEMVALVVAFGLSGLVKHGSEIEVKEGTIITAYVDQDTALPPP
jgi:hypothetical protein